MPRKALIEKFKEIDIYPVISSELTAGRGALAILRAVAAGGAKIVQLREKNQSDAEVYRLASEFRKVTRDYNMLLIIDDRLDVALAVGADGVHLGLEDLPIAEARKIAPKLLLGASAHNLEEAVMAQDDGADYVNIGPIYPTETKTLPFPALGESAIAEIAPKLTVPFTVMGGIKADKIKKLIGLGASRIAMVTEISLAEEPAAKIRQLRAITGA